MKPHPCSWISGLAALGLAWTTLAADPVVELLQKGLLEEEVNRNLPAALQAYEQAVQQADAQRRTTATALFRLAEAYRRLGRTNEATVQYRRVAEQFADQTNLATLSQSQLSRLAPSAPSTPSLPSQSSSTATPEEARLLREELKLAEQELLSARKKLENGKAEPAEVRRAERELLRLQRLLPENAGREQQSSLFQQEIKIAELHLQEVQARIQVGTAPPLDEVGARRELLSLQRQLAASQRPTPPPTAQLEPARLPPAPTVTPPEPEQSEINRLAKLLKESPDLLEARNTGSPGGSTPALHKEVALGFFRATEFLLTNGADPNVRDGARQTPLHAAANRGHRDLCELLVARGADINARDQSDVTPLHIAASKDFAVVAQLLLARKAAVNARAGECSQQTPLHFAAMNGATRTLIVLAKAGAEVDALDAAGKSPLYLAVENGQLDAVQTLLALKASPNQADSEGNPPLDAAIKLGQIAMLRTLLEAGSDPSASCFHARTEHGNPVKQSLLHWAIYCRPNADMIRLLLEAKVDPNTPDATGVTPLNTAISLQQYVPRPEQRKPLEQIAQLLIAHGARASDAPPPKPPPAAQ